jgi:DNA-binding CsgD family transcriptional regulator/tetratricopeptide (TPR) repeat protein
MPLLPKGDVFVGREREMGELTVALDDALAGKGRIVMLVGEPGIGKTRTSQEFSAIAEQRGAQVFWGRCHEGEGAPPYWPWVQAIRSYVQQSDSDSLADQTGAGAADIAEIVPDIKAKLPKLEPPPQLGSPEASRFRLFDSITTFLKNSSHTQPLVLVLEDLHWADASTLLLFEFTAGEIDQARLLILGTFRDVEVSRHHRLTETIGRITRQPSFTRIQLSGLERDDVGSLIEANSRARPSSGAIERIHARTEGNPLFVQQLARLLSDTEQAERWENITPQPIRDVIGERLNKLSQGCNRILTIASVIGREFGFELLGIVADMSDDDLLEVIDEALESHVIEEAYVGRERYEFSHALIQETLYHELSSSRRVRLHARIAEALEKIYESDVETHAEELAYHYSEASAMIGPDKLVRYSLLAGERALASYAWEDAHAHFERALAAKEGQAMDAERAALLLGVGRTQSFSHHWEEAMESLVQALDYFEKVGDVTSVIKAGDCSFPPPAWPQFLPIRDRMLRIIPPESHEAAQVLSRSGPCLAYVGDYEGAQDALSRALAIARREGDKFLEIGTLQRHSIAELHFLHFDECLAKAMAGIKLASSVDNPVAEIFLHHHAATIFLCSGDLERARVHAANSLGPGERTHQILRIAHALVINERVASAAGDWDAARGFGDRHLKLGSLLTEEEQLASSAMLEYQTGEFEQFEFYLGRLHERINSGASPVLMDRFWVVELARMSGTVRDLNFVKVAAEQVLSSRLSPLLIKAARVALALTALKEGDAASSQELYSSLQPFRGTMDFSGLISLDRLLALLVSLTGRIDDAAAHFEAALDFARKGGYGPEQAWACHDYAEALLMRDARGDRDNALSLLDEAHAVSQRLAMRPLMEKVAALRESVGATRRVAPAYPDGLTEREVEVLRLIAAGKTDREIADELFISIRTASTHVRNILNKTGCANRAEAASYANRNDLV